MGANQVLDDYRRLLSEVESLLEHYGDSRWPPILREWIGELDDLLAQSPAENLLVAHLERTKHALGGMGSIGDVVICPEAGHDVQNNEQMIHNANTELLALVDMLFRKVESLLHPSAP